MSTLVLLRHGESTWNAENLFTGWWDVDLSPAGEVQATQSGAVMADAEIALDVVHTSLQTRAIRTANLALDEMGLSWLPVRRHWRLNERHYGDLTGKNKAETTEKYGEEQVFIWRRSYDVRPPATAPDNPYNPNSDRRYADLPPEVLPSSECLADVVDRMLPYWFDGIVPDLAMGRVVLVAAHGNSLRALIKHLDRISRRRHRRPQHRDRRSVRLRARRPLRPEAAQAGHRARARRSPGDRGRGPAGGRPGQAEDVARQNRHCPTGGGDRSGSGVVAGGPT